MYTDLHTLWIHLLTNTIVQACCLATSNKCFYSALSGEEKVAAVRDMMLKLPPVNLEVLQYLIFFLKRVRKFVISIFVRVKNKQQTGLLYGHPNAVSC